MNKYCLLLVCLSVLSTACKSDIDEKANKWNFKTYRNYLQKQKIDVDSIFDKIKDIIIKSLILSKIKSLSTFCF